MNLKQFISVIMIAVACTFVGKVRADVFPAGDLVGIFSSNGGGDVDIGNFSDGNASFRTGVATANSFRSGITFTGGAFTGLTEGESVSLGSLSYYNGITEIGTSSHGAVLDLYLRFTDPLLSWVHLSTLNFVIDATLNARGNAVPDNFLADYTSAGSAWIGGEKVEYSISGLPAMTSVAENSKVDLANLMLSVGPSVAVREQGNSLLLLVLGLGMIGIQRLRLQWGCW